MTDMNQPVGNEGEKASPVHQYEGAGHGSQGRRAYYPNQREYMDCGHQIPSQ